MQSKHDLPRIQRQHGAVLVVGLIFLAMLSLMGAAAFSVATQEERMSGNSRDRIRAFESAEASLRDCESQVVSAAPLPAFTVTGSGGMYVAPPVTEYPMYERVDWKSMSGAVRVLATPLTNVSRQPACIVEEMVFVEEDIGGQASGPSATVENRIYRVSATGWGLNSSSTAFVQSIYRR